jgi:hypothetical protein
MVFVGPIAPSDRLGLAVEVPEGDRRVLRLNFAPAVGAQEWVISPGRPPAHTSPDVFAIATLRRRLSSPATVGLGGTLQLVPFHLCTKVWFKPVEASKIMPTAQNPPVGSAATSSRRLAAELIGGPVITDQVTPSQCSARGRILGPCVVYPTAKMSEGEAAVTLVSALSRGPTLPLATMLHTEPSQCSVSVLTPTPFEE